MQRRAFIGLKNKNARVKSAEEHVEEHCTAASGELFYFQMNTNITWMGSDGTVEGSRDENQEKNSNQTAWRWKCESLWCW